MKKYDLFAICLTLIVFTVCYLTSNNIFLSLGLFVIYLAFYFLLARKKINKYILTLEKASDCFGFISSFLITLSSKDSLDEAYISGTRNKSNKFNELNNNMNQMTSFEKIEYLKKYFSFSVYSMFVKVISLHMEQGGNVLKLSESLLNEIRRIEDSINQTISINRKKTFEYFLLWFMSFLVLIFLRLSLSSFYQIMLSSNIFFILLIAYYLLFLFAIYSFINKFVIVPIKEETYEKD